MGDKRETVKLVLKILSIPLVMALISFCRNLLSVRYANMPFEKSIPLLLKRSLVVAAISCAVLLAWFLIKLIIYLIENRKNL